MSKTWFITGASSGFGQSIANAALEKGDKVVATFRQQEQADNFKNDNGSNAHAVVMDVTKPEEIKLAVQDAHETMGNIDILVNNAGYGSFGTIEEISEEEARRQFEVNVYGVLNVTRALLPQMRREKSGHIFNISSIAGYKGVPALGLYSASKAAVHSISEALSIELMDLNIKVTNIEPGLFKTSFFEKSTLDNIPKEIEDYEDVREDTIDYFEEAKKRTDVGNPDKLAKLVTRLSTEDEPPLHVVCGQEQTVQGAIDKLSMIQEEIKKWMPISGQLGFEQDEPDYDQKVA